YLHGPVAGVAHREHQFGTASIDDDWAVARQQLSRDHGTSPGIMGVAGIMGLDGVRSRASSRPEKSPPPAPPPASRARLRAPRSGGARPAPPPSARTPGARHGPPPAETP